MQDIRLVGNDGEYLNLETQSGEQFRLVLDDSVRAAVKRESTIALDQVSITPREIQDAIRAGATADELAAKYSVPFEYVDKFAQTVIDEIGHIIASAQTVRIAIAADRFSEAKSVEFKEVLQERLQATGSSIQEWSALKLEGSPWKVSVRYADATSSPKAATWSFDQRRLILSPENEYAAVLTSGEFTREAEMPKLRALDEVIPAAVTEVITEVVELIIEETPPTPIVKQVSAIEELTKSSVSAFEEVAAPEVEEPKPLSDTVDLLEALRKKRAATEAKSAHAAKQPTVEETISPVTNSVDVKGFVESPVEFQDSQEMPAEPVAPAKKGRPSMPSWDEIVFGTKTDE